MYRITLSEIALAVGASVDFEREITNISTDTRTITDGSLFIAIRGENFDGHTFAHEAFNKGACAVIVDREIDGVPCIVVKDTIRAYLDIAKMYRSKFNPIVVGVTGSVGKTTTKEMVSLVLSERFNTLKTEGNLNNEIGLPKTLLRLNEEHEAAVIEMGMIAKGEIEILSATTQPTIAVVTNVGYSHIENLKTQENILQAKMEIVEGLKPNGILLLNADDKLLFPQRDMVKNRVVTYGMLNSEADARASNITDNGISTFFTATYKGESIAFEIPCIGNHNILNALVAMVIGVESGIKLSEIANALKKYKADSLRQNIQKYGENTVIIDCYNASPDSMKASLSVLSTLNIEKGGRKIAVLGDMLELGDKSKELHELVGDYVGESKADIVFCYGSESQNIAHKALSYSKSVIYSSDKSLICKALKGIISENDIVLFKGSRGMKLEEIINEVFPQ